MTEKTYRRGTYKVTIAENGAIKVRANDILSGYSMAVEGNPWTVYDYGRFDSRGNLDRVRDVDHIIDGETLYHIPTYCAWYVRTHSARPIPPPIRPVPPVSDEEKRKNLKEFARKVKLPPEVKSAVEHAIEVAHGIEALATIAEVLAVLEWMPFVGMAASLIGWILILWLAGRAGIYKFKTLAGFYTTVAWAFEHGDPKPSETFLKKKQEETGYTTDDFKKAWWEQVAKTKQWLNEHFTANNKVARKAFKQIFGRGDPQTLFRYLVTQSLSAIEKKVGRNHTDYIRLEQFLKEFEYPN